MSTSQTIHFAAFWKNKPALGVVPYCQRYAFSYRGGLTTEDKSKVNCTRCAKALDITPAPKMTSSTRGTCQGCFSKYETHQHDQNWDVVLHGFQRPGIGFLLGECRGHGHVPFEVSCEQTKVFRAELVQFKAEQQAWLKMVVGNEVPSFTAKVATGKRVPDNSTPKRRAYGYETAEYKSVEVPLGQGEIPNPFQPERPWEKVPSYETLRNQAAVQTRNTISQVEEQIKFLTKMINSWKPVAFPLAK
jgi:hypothetical protein